MEGNSIQAMRIALTAVYAIQYQTQAQRQRQIRKAPAAMLACAACGKPVTVRRRPRLGEPVYCRGVSRCRVRAFRARQRAQQQAEALGPVLVAVTPGQAPEPARGRAYEPSPADIWLAMRAG